MIKGKVWRNSALIAAGCALVFCLGLVGCQSQAVASEAPEVAEVSSLMTNEEMAALVENLDREVWGTEHEQAFAALFRHEDASQEPGDHIALLLAHATFQVHAASNQIGLDDQARLRLIDEEFIPRFADFELEGYESFGPAMIERLEAQRAAILAGEPFEWTPLQMD